MPRRPRDDSLAATFGARVRHHRENMGVSQEKLAEITGVHRTMIGKVERGETSVSLDTIVRIAAAMDVRVSELLDGF